MRGYIPVRKRRTNLFKINDVCRKLKITPRTVRYYESLGLLPSVQRTKGRMRLYTPQDLEWLSIILDHQEQGKTLQEIKELLRPPAAGQRVKVLIDSTFSIHPSELPPDWEIVPMEIGYGYYCYKDYLTLEPGSFAAFEQKKKKLGKTRAPSIDDYRELFTACFAQGYIRIISLHADSRIAEAYERAAAAAKRLGSLPIDVIDTKLLALEFREVLNRYKIDPQPKQLPAIIQDVQKNTTEIFVILSMERFLPLVTDGLQKRILEYIPVLQHTAEHGFVPIARLDTPAEAFEYIARHGAYARTWLGYSSPVVWEKYKKDTARFGEERHQYSSVIMANLGREVIGLAGQS
jgi:DNA-binding transcriptional MerR regulator